METRGKETLREMIEESGNIVFFGGAGVSTESGIPDFRSADGLYFMKYDYPPEEILSRDFFERNPEEFYRFYRDKILVPSMGAKPNAAHLRLAELEKRKKLCAVVTQNIDGLLDECGKQECFGAARLYTAELLCKMRKALYARRNSRATRNSSLPLRRDHPSGCGALRRGLGSGRA